MKRSFLRHCFLLGWAFHRFTFCRSNNFLGYIIQVKFFLARFTLADVNLRFSNIIFRASLNESVSFTWHKFFSKKTGNDKNLFYLDCKVEILPWSSIVLAVDSSFPATHWSDPPIENQQDFNHFLFTSFNHLIDNRIKGERTTFSLVLWICDLPTVFVESSFYYSVPFKIQWPRDTRLFHPFAI